MSFKDLDLMYKGWQELERSRRFDSWEQIRTLLSPHLKRGTNIDSVLRNPYAPKPKKGAPITVEEVEKRIKKWDELQYEPHPMYKNR